MGCVPVLFLSRKFVASESWSLINSMAVRQDYLTVSHYSSSHYERFHGHGTHHGPRPRLSWTLSVQWAVFRCHLLELISLSHFNKLTSPWPGQRWLKHASQDFWCKIWI